LNLTAADHVFLCDPWWNPAVEEQAADRAHRIGQDKPVNVYRMVAKDTVEERILQLQEKKRAIATTVTSGAGGAAGITKAELLSLLEEL
jgi:SNF2 family DNA or RNA helicase